MLFVDFKLNIQILGQLGKCICISLMELLWIPQGTVSVYVDICICVLLFARSAEWRSVLVSFLLQFLVAPLPWWDTSGRPSSHPAPALAKTDKLCSAALVPLQFQKVSMDPPAAGAALLESTRRESLTENVTAEQIKDLEICRLWFNVKQSQAYLSKVCCEIVYFVCNFVHLWTVFLLKLTQCTDMLICLWKVHTWVTAPISSAPVPLQALEGLAWCPALATWSWQPCTAVPNSDLKSYVDFQVLVLSFCICQDFSL